ncbi:hypothetical protein [Microbulbifer thermotolerans]|uniref:Uncharacterized protein n=1 Tax=Microbulbifer thermotolerans TaxID=252514 RepID=A0AB35HY60_MICTH|nr:hypothetical protein [Microbulbifer thermotolerans]MCX2780421.1 hypothetical protein [Microbulbifer thermotolerans]MCX2802255.1 hypothetical protein [Microbulbifer thermotolerans]MCX2805907.1 hypothetical protein [Microbulbifer thermotolerans]
MDKSSKVNEITITRSTKVKGKFVDRNSVLNVGSDIEKNDAIYLLRSGKAVPGKQIREDVSKKGKG